MNRVFKLVHLTAASAVISLAIAGPSFAASSQGFTDIQNVAAKEAILALQQSGIISGVAPSLFAPYDSLTEAQAIQMIVDALGLNLDGVRFVKEPKASDYFANANDNAWYANALITAAVCNIGLPKDLDPGQKVSREVFTHQLIRAIESSGRLPMINIVPVGIKDGDQINAEYSGSIQRALHYGIVKLNADGQFNPTQDMTREQAAEEIYNAVQYLKSHEAPPAAADTVTASEGVQLIADTLGLAGTDIQIKIDPDAKMTRESFVSLFVQTLKSSGKLPMINIVPVDIKDGDQIDILNSGAVQLAVALGFVRLSDEGAFHPKGDLTRADATEIAGNVAAYLKAHPAPSAPAADEEGSH